MEIDRIRRHDRACARDDRDLHAGAEARVEADRHALARGRGEQELLEILPEDDDGLLVGARLELEAEVELHGGGEEAAVRVLDDESHLHGRRVTAYELVVEHGRDALGGCVDRGDQEALCFTAADSEHAMRGNLGELLREVVIVLELRDLFLLPGDDARAGRA